MACAPTSIATTRRWTAPTRVGWRAGKGAGSPEPGGVLSPEAQAQADVQILRGSTGAATDPIAMVNDVGVGGVASQQAASNETTSATNESDVVTSFDLRYAHERKPYATTNVDNLRAQIGRQVDRLNSILRREGLGRLKVNIREYMTNPNIRRRAATARERLGSPGTNEDGAPLAWCHEPDPCLGGHPENDINPVPDLARNDYIIGANSRRLRREILDLPDTVNTFTWSLTLTGPEPSNSGEDG